MKTLHKITLLMALSLSNFLNWVWAIFNVVIGAQDLGKSNLIGVFQLLERVLSRDLLVELINHGKDAHLNAWLQVMVTDYRETSDGTTLLRKAGIPDMRVACLHFASSLDRLETMEKPRQ